MRNYPAGALEAQGGWRTVPLPGGQPSPPAHPGTPSLLTYLLSDTLIRQVVTEQLLR